MGAVYLQGLAQRADGGVHRRQVVTQPLGQGRGGSETGQVHVDHVALGRQEMDHRVPGLPVVTDAVQQEQRLAAAHARVGQGHGPRAVRGGDLEGDGGGHGGSSVGESSANAG
ncbi:hypothetical protein GCM10014715_12860 [Streptomyces spiralis]|uniref:Uncharacterized protein n=1 Tax=Streptomyces spiralis TaxID=66376 RepID=A0A918ZMC0_9ACTN|nr:hypothetical protein GCM10014715_12860 [Streptomyces spiralis]